MSEHRQTLLIIGASARYCAESAVRAGFDCIAADQYCDWDLQNIAEAHQIDSFRRFDVEAFTASLSRMPDLFMITGGMEKRPELVARLMETITCGGTAPDQIIRCKNPFELADVCRARSIRFPQSLEADIGYESLAGRWLLKPWRSAGGVGIQTATDCILDELLQSGGGSGFFLQRWIPGSHYSSVFSAGDTVTTLIGSTRQLVGLRVFGARQFAYCGSIGPITLPGTRDELVRMGGELAAAFQLRGIFGLDWILDRTGRIWLIEINPRLPASAEVLELSGACRSIVEAHFNPDAASNLVPELPLERPMVGKAVLFLDRADAYTVTDRDVQWLIRRYKSNQRRTIADIPRGGTKIASGCPVLTMYQEGSDLSVILHGLEHSARQIRGQIISTKPICKSN